jgi:hypothetical protein
MPQSWINDLHEYTTPCGDLTSGVRSCRRVHRTRLGSGYARSALRPVGHEDAEREPDGSRRVPADNIAHEMNAQVDSAEPDEQNEACKERNRRPAREMGWGNAREQVSQFIDELDVRPLFGTLPALGHFHAVATSGRGVNHEDLIIGNITRRIFSVA